MKRFVSLVALTAVLVSLFTLYSSETVSAHSMTVNTPHALLKANAPATARIATTFASEYDNCDAYGAGTWDQYNDLLCAVASYATPCLRVHAWSNFNNILECAAPGTILAMPCQNYIPSDTVNGNSYWDEVVFNPGTNNAYYGLVADAYMDTEWTNNTGSPTLIQCGG